MIQNEVAILRRVKHPNIVLLIEEVDTYNELYLVMELVKVRVHGYIIVLSDLFFALLCWTKKRWIAIFFTHCVPAFIMSNLRWTARSREAETVTAKFNHWSQGWIPTSHTVLDRENWSVASSACVVTFFIPSHSLRGEMFLHNSGAGNVIHLFMAWCRVLQNIDERQSVEQVCVYVWACPKEEDRVEAADEWGKKWQDRRRWQRERERRDGFIGRGGKRSESDN